MKKSNVLREEKIVLTIALKYNQLKRDGLENLEIDQFVNYLFKYKWKDCSPKSISSAIIEIMSSDANKIVAFLSNDAVIKSKHSQISDYEDLFEKSYD